MCLQRSRRWLLRSLLLSRQERQKFQLTVNLSKMGGGSREFTGALVRSH